MAKLRRLKKIQPLPMSREEAEEMYGFHLWGLGYFSVGDHGDLRVHPTKEKSRWASLPDVIEIIRKRRIHPPVVLRFPQIIETQVADLYDAFNSAIRRHRYGGKYRGVFPIKVNQTNAFISAVVAAGASRHYGLEAGTKPELALALGSGLRPGSLIICNGYKDEAYIELALAGQRLGFEVIIILEKFVELGLALKVAKKLKLKPVLGLRLKLHARGSGKWESSGGDASKFGLTTAEIMEAVRICRDEGFADCIRVLHFHIGSQITDLRRVTAGVTEGARFYAALRNDGLDLRYVDIGGGLGVDYEGSRSTSDSSMNYDMGEYTEGVIATIAADLNERIKDKTISGGMIPKARAAIMALEKVRRTVTALEPSWPWEITR